MKKHLFSIIALFSILGIVTTNLSAATDYAMSFSQDGQGIQVPQSDSLNIDGPLTMEAWIYAKPAIYKAYYNFIISKHMNGTGYAIGTEGNAEEKFIESFKINTNQWMHVAVVLSEDAYRLYINSVLAVEKNAMQAAIFNTNDLFIGHSPFGAELNWKGVIDEVRVWNVERTQAEIYQDMYKKPAKNATGLVAYWDFNEDINKKTVFDKSGNKNHGVLFTNGSTPVSALPKRIKSDRPSLLTRPIQ